MVRGIDNNKMYPDPKRPKETAMKCPQCGKQMTEDGDMLKCKDCKISTKKGGHR